MRELRLKPAIIPRRTPFLDREAPVMNQKQWQDVLLSPGNEDQAWELFHENSKNNRFSMSATGQEVRDHVNRLHESLPFEGYPMVELPWSLEPLQLSLEKAITTRASVRDLTACPLTLPTVATLLHYGYGVSRERKDIDFPRSLRVIPSAGALYPLEIFFHTTRIEGLNAGLYHYNPSKNHLRLLREGDETRKIAEAMVQTEVALNAALIMFITAFFERSVFKYKDRGYRFVLLEAGHVAQNLNLVSNALGLGSLNIGGFFDREIDEFLGLDGVAHSTIYMVAIGKKSGQG
jgi:SagB-type dehydrogenase family enzyme